MAYQISFSSEEDFDGFTIYGRGSHFGHVTQNA